MESLPIEVQLAIMDRQIQEWREVGYAAELAAKVHARIGSDPGSVQSYAQRAITAERAIDVLTAMRAELVGQGGAGAQITTSGSDRQADH